MTTSRPTHFLSEIGRPDATIPESKLVYLRERARNRLYDYILRKFMATGMSQSALARRIGRRPEVVNRWLGSPGNLTMDSISDLLVGIAAEEIEPASSSLLGRAPRNDVKPDWLKATAAAQGGPGGADDQPSQGSGIPSLAAV